MAQPILNKLYTHYTRVSYYTPVCTIAQKNNRRIPRALTRKPFLIILPRASESGESHDPRTGIKVRAPHVRYYRTYIAVCVCLCDASDSLSLSLSLLAVCVLSISPARALESLAGKRVHGFGLLASEEVR